MRQLTSELEKYRSHIEAVASNYNLSFFDTIFELVDFDEMRLLASYEGFTERYAHWRFGMNYHRFLKTDEYGLSKIYELVINHDPCYAYLLDSNAIIDQKLVISHVLGHSDFFKNNKWFSRTNRKMKEQMSDHASQVESHIARHGYDKVEEVIDKLLVLDNLIDRHSPYRMTDSEFSQKPKDPSSPSPIKDILLFLMYNNGLESWEVDLLCMIRRESYYFSPQFMTKIMNEGWASYWHSKLMTEQLVTDKDIIGFADRHSSATVMTETHFNPYKVGIELFRYIKLRWDKGQFGNDWENCSDSRDKLNWDTQARKGEEKIFEVRKTYNDATFIDEFLTEDFCSQYHIPFEVPERMDSSQAFVRWKNALLDQMFNSGHPVVQIIDSNYKEGGLLIEHLHEGSDLDVTSTQKCLESLFFVWKKPVWFKTKKGQDSRFLCFDGKKHKTD